MNIRSTWEGEVKRREQDDAMARHRSSLAQRAREHRAEMRFKNEQLELEAEAAQRKAEQEQANADRRFELEKEKFLSEKEDRLLARQQEQANDDRSFQQTQNNFERTKILLEAQLRETRLNAEKVQWALGVERKKEEQRVEDELKERDTQQWLEMAGYVMTNDKNTVRVFQDYDKNNDGTISDEEIGMEFSCKAYNPDHFEVLSRIANRATGGKIKKIEQAYHFIDGSLMVKDADTKETDMIMTGDKVYSILSAAANGGEKLVSTTGNMFQSYYQNELAKKKAEEFKANALKAFDNKYLSSLYQERTKIINLMNEQKSQQGSMDSLDSNAFTTLLLGDTSRNDLQESLDYIDSEIKYQEKLRGVGLGLYQPTEQTNQSGKYEVTPPPTGKKQNTETQGTTEKYQVYPITNKETGELFYVFGKDKEDALNKIKQNPNAGYKTFDEASNASAKAYKTDMTNKINSQPLYNNNSPSDRADLLDERLTYDDKKNLLETNKGFIQKNKFVSDSIESNPLAKNIAKFYSIPEKVWGIPYRNLTDSDKMHEHRKDYDLNKIIELETKRRGRIVFNNEKNQKVYERYIKKLIESPRKDDQNMGLNELMKLDGSYMTTSDFVYHGLRNYFIDIYQSSENIKQRAQIIDRIKDLDSKYNEYKQGGK